MEASRGATRTRGSRPARRRPQVPADVRRRAALALIAAGALNVGLSSLELLLAPRRGCWHRGVNVAKLTLLSSVELAVCASGLRYGLRLRGAVAGGGGGGSLRTDRVRAKCLESPPASVVSGASRRPPRSREGGDAAAPRRRIAPYHDGAGHGRRCDGG